AHWSGHLGARHEVHIAWIQTGADIGIDEIHADGFGLDQDFTRTRGWLWLLDIAQDFRTTDFGDFDCVHGDYHPQARSPHEVGPARHPPSSDRAGRFATRRRRGSAGRAAQAWPACPVAVLG